MISSIGSISDLKRMTWIYMLWEVMKEIEPQCDVQEVSLSMVRGKFQ